MAYDHFYRPVYRDGVPLTQEPLVDEVSPVTLSDYRLPVALNIRNFVPSVKRLDLSIADLAYHSVGYLAGIKLGKLHSTDTSYIGSEDWLGEGLDQTALGDYYQYNEAHPELSLDLMIQDEIERYPGIGEKTQGETALLIPLPPAGTSKLYTSRYISDNLINGFNDQFGNYYIELRSIGTPYGYLDMVNSYISFSSSVDNDPAETDYLYFKDNITNIGGYGDHSLQWKRDTHIVNADPTSIKRIDLNIASLPGSSGEPLKLMGLRLFDYYKTYYNITQNTKTGLLQKTTALISQPPPYPLMNTGTTKGINYTQLVNFFSGVMGEGLENKFSVYLRADPGSGGDYIRADFTFTDSGSEFKAFDGIKNVFSASTNVPLKAQTHYVAQLELIDDQLRMTIWEKEFGRMTEIYFNSQQIDHPIRVDKLSPGFTAFSFAPGSWNFTIQNLFTRDHIYGELTSNLFKTITPIIGASLYENSSGPDQAIKDFYDVEEGVSVDHLSTGHPESGADDGSFEIVEGRNDSVVSLDSETSISPFRPSLRVTKGSQSLVSGVQWNDVLYLPNTQHASIEGKIRFTRALSGGTFRVVLFDRFYKNVMKVAYLTVNRNPNEWHDFSVPISTNAITEWQLRAQFQFFGQAAGTFWLGDLRIQTASVVWEASNNDGRTYVDFGDLTNDRYQGINFLTPGRDIRVRAKALSRNAWINRYELTPRYAQLGSSLAYSDRITYENLPAVTAGFMINDAIFDLPKYEDLPTYFPTYEVFGDE